MNILVTGSAGFIGYHLVNQLLKTVRDIAELGVDGVKDETLIKYCSRLKQKLKSKPI